MNNLKESISTCGSPKSSQVYYFVGFDERAQLLLSGTLCVPE